MPEILRYQLDWKGQNEWLAGSDMNQRSGVPLPCWPCMGMPMDSRVAADSCFKGGGGMGEGALW